MQSWISHTTFQFSEQAVLQRDSLYSTTIELIISAQKIEKNDRCNLFYALEEVAAKAPNRIFLVYQGREWTYMEIKLQTQRYANYFLSIGIKSKGIFGILSLG
jgi:hypothetical protein